MFETDFHTILKKTESIDPITYGGTGNFINGAVSRLSPYISRGVISTKFVFDKLTERGIAPFQAEKFIQELAWRDYWQLVWLHKGDEINRDLKQEQQGVNNFKIPINLILGQTGIEAVDKAISDFYTTGYLHNHIRMYIASLACNIAGSHWKMPAQWMYYHLLDGDWASNALSWQWVAGANSHKKYFANQENINRYCFTKQTGSYLDIPYEGFPISNIPAELSETTQGEFPVQLPENKPLQINPELPCLIYNSYNLDPLWRKGFEATRILLLEPTHFKTYPVSEKVLDFILKLSDNIPGIQIFTGEFQELKSKYDLKTFYFKEHPLNKHYQGTEDPRDWMFNESGYHNSFFSFWNKCKKQLDL
jgi:deoxyribodipyrimidine photo-lyase